MPSTASVKPFTHTMLRMQSSVEIILLATVSSCESCHYSIHEGGKYRSGTVQFSVEEFPYYKG